MKIPSNLKFKKFHKIKFKEKTKFVTTGKTVFGFCLQAIERRQLFSSQIEAGRRAIRRVSRKVGDIKINAHSVGTLTKKPTSSRMGKGKGAIDRWFFPTRIGTILYDFNEASQQKRLRRGDNLCNLKIQASLNSAKTKLPGRSRIYKFVY